MQLKRTERLKARMQKLGLGTDWVYRYRVQHFNRSDPVYPSLSAHRAAYSPPALPTPQALSRPVCMRRPQQFLWARRKNFPGKKLFFAGNHKLPDLRIRMHDLMALGTIFVFTLGDLLFVTATFSFASNSTMLQMECCRRL